MAGYLFDRTTVKAPEVLCNDLYRFVLRVFPGFDSDAVLADILVEAFPDVQTWQYMGRRFCPLPPAGRKSPRPVRPYVNYFPDGKVRPTQPDQVQYGFSTAALRDEAVVVLRANGYQIAQIWNEPDYSS